MTLHVGEGGRGGVAVDSVEDHPQSPACGKRLKARAYRERAQWSKIVSRSSRGLLHDVTGRLFLVTYAH